MIAIGILGCDRNRSTAGDAPATNSSAGASPETPKPGYIIGRITRPDGSPVAINGTSFTVLINGVSGQGENVSFNPLLAADGSYSFKVPSGIYHPVQASLKVKRQRLVRLRLLVAVGLLL